MSVPPRDFLIEICDHPSLFSSTYPGDVEPRTHGRARLHLPPEFEDLVADDIVVVASLRLNPRSASDGARGRNDVERLTDAVREAGANAVDRLEGDFSFVAVGARSVIAARDHMGVRPLYYSVAEGRCAFATRSGLLLSLDWIRSDIDPLSVGDYLLSLYEDRERTFFTGVQRLAAGHVLVIEGGGQRRRGYWDPRTVGPADPRDDEAYVRLFRDAFVTSVRSRVDPSVRTATTLSGGLDSSSVAGVARTIVEGGELHAFSGLFDRSPRSDERAYIQSVVATGGIVPHELRLDDIAPLQSFGDVRSVFDEPFFAPNLFLHAQLMRAARDEGCSCLLDGLDGDTAVSHGLGRLVELARGLRLPTLTHELRAVANGIGGTTPSGLLWRSVIRPLLLRRPRLLIRALRPTPECPWGDSAFVNPAFARELDLPARYLDLSEARSRPAGTQREEHARRIAWPLHQYMLEVLFRLGSHVGIESRYPFYDPRVIETAISLPAALKLRNGWTRYVLRKGMEDFLPPDVAWRPDKGDLGENFNRAFLRFELPHVRAIVDQSQHGVWDYADRSKVIAALETIQKGSESSIMPLWIVLSLAPWFH